MGVPGAVTEIDSAVIPSKSGASNLLPVMEEVIGSVATLLLK